MQPILEFNHVFYTYPGQQQTALNDFNLVIPPGENIAIVGRNGAGKSTFFLHCNGLFKPDQGQVSFQGQPLAYDRRALQRLRQQVGLVFQNADDQLFSASVAQDISFGPLNLKLAETEVRHRVQMAAELCEVTELLERPTHALSGGEKARVALAGVLAMDPQLLVADELMATLDPWVRLTIFAILGRLHDQGKTILLATHNLQVIKSWASFVVVIAKGAVAFSGPPAELLDNQAVLEQTGLAKIWHHYM